MAAGCKNDLISPTLREPVGVVDVHGERPRQCVHVELAGGVVEDRAYEHATVPRLAHRQGARTAKKFDVKGRPPGFRAYGRAR
jgi:hypothetical protein